jgi:Haem-binding domain
MGVKARRQEYCQANPGTDMWNPAQSAPRFRSGGQLKKRLASILLSGIALLTVCSVVVHPFGAIKAQRSDKPLLLDSTFSPQVVTIIERSCQNCHSEKTEWPWYSYVAPMSWMIENDVHRGRSHMNLSRWNGYNPQEQQEMLLKMSTLVRNRAMCSSCYNPGQRSRPPVRATPDRDSLWQLATRAEKFTACKYSRPAYKLFRPKLSNLGVRRPRR